MPNSYKNTKVGRSGFTVAPADCCFLKRFVHSILGASIVGSVTYSAIVIQQIQHYTCVDVLQQLYFTG
jgi:hypothetical protein